MITPGSYCRLRGARMGLVAACLLVASGMVAGHGVGRVSAQDEPAGDRPPAQAAPPTMGQSPMQQLANPTGPGALGPRQFTSAHFEAGELAWMLVSTLVALLLIPGSILFYTGWLGMRRGTELATTSVFFAAVLCLSWSLWIYSLGFAHNVGVASLPVDRALEQAGVPVIGGADHVGLRNLDSQVRARDHEHRQRRFNDPVPHMAFLTFQMFVFVAAAMPLIVSLWEYLTFGRLMILLLAWGTLVYAPVANWVWGFGWLRQAVVLDFAGAAVVHVSAGFTALAAALVFRRHAAFTESGSQDGLVALGLTLYWMGSLAVHAGCAHAASPQGASAVLTVQLAACSGLVGWAGLDWLRDGRTQLVRACGGAVAGLAAIAASSGYVAPQAGIVIGLFGGLISAGVYRALSVTFRDNAPLNVFVLQGVAGVTGLLLAAIFVSPSVAFGPGNVPVVGVLGGNLKPLGVQALACGATAGWSFLIGLLLSHGVAVCAGVPDGGRGVTMTGLLLAVGRVACRRRGLTWGLFGPGLATLIGCGDMSMAPAQKRTEPGQPAYFRQLAVPQVPDFVNYPQDPEAYFMPDIMGSGVALWDYDGDDDLDILLLTGGPADHPKLEARGCRLFRHDPGLVFTDVTDAAGLKTSVYAVGVAIGDVDNDGDLDCFIAAYGPDELWRNNGDETFTNVTDSAGITNVPWSTAASFFDYDRDGRLDLFVGNYVDYYAGLRCEDASGRPDFCNPKDLPGTVDRLLHNVTEPGGDVRFVDVTVEAGLASESGRALGVLCRDFDGDGRPDIYVANDMDPNFLWIQQPDGTFQNEGYLRGVACNLFGDVESSMGVAVGDFQQDSLMDVVVMNLRGQTNTLYAGQPGGVFVDSTPASGIGPITLQYTTFGVAAIDLDCDGDLDLAMVNGSVMHAPGTRRGSRLWDEYARTESRAPQRWFGAFREHQPLGRSFHGAT